jgi:hypothetical protein
LVVVAVGNCGGVVKPGSVLTVDIDGEAGSGAIVVGDAVAAYVCSGAVVGEAFGVGVPPGGEEVGRVVGSGGLELGAVVTSAGVPLDQLDKTEFTSIPVASALA